MGFNLDVQCKLVFVVDAGKWLIESFQFSFSRVEFSPSFRVARFEYNIPQRTIQQLFQSLGKSVFFFLALYSCFFNEKVIERSTSMIINFNKLINVASRAY